MKKGLPAGTQAPRTTLLFLSATPRKYRVSDVRAFEQAGEASASRRKSGRREKTWSGMAAKSAVARFAESSAWGMCALGETSLFNASQLMSYSMACFSWDRRFPAARITVPADGRVLRYRPGASRLQ
jgi:hypothetical protein